ncbi:hypothetical protein MMC30_002101 [Trapelia coarctata]|nr:hypothetical protein [Trapelia coarctata]
MVNELLQRQVAMLSSGLDHNAEELYPVLASEAPSLQLAAFHIFHKQIPKKQEEASIEAALSQDHSPSLPEELLSLILTAPSYESLGDSIPDGTLPLPLKGYLLSWILIFDHWTNASYKLRNVYATSIKESTYLKSFLDLAFDYLIDSRVKPVDASQFNIYTYAPGIEDIPEKEAQWLFIHIYYLCCKNLPTLSRAWWRDECPRNLQKPIEAWTEKYISPTVIKHELSSVSTWLPTQATTSNEIPLTVKISHHAHELTAAHPVDDTEMAIRISLPLSYPLSPTTVNTVHRVGIDEKKWRAWLLTTSGVINFSSTGGSGGLVEGLVAWRKNVTGALKGQSECAICYSVVSAEKGLPNKRCGTCRNLFHGSCLYKW